MEKILAFRSLSSRHLEKDWNPTGTGPFSRIPEKGNPIGTGPFSRRLVEKEMALFDLHPFCRSLAVVKGQPLPPSVL